MENIAVVKNQNYIVDIIDNGIEGGGIAKIDNFTIFVPGAIKGEKVKILIVKVLTSYAYGKIIEIIKESNSRVELDCATYKRCGGCNLRHIDYEETLNIKKDMVQNLANAVGNPTEWKVHIPVNSQNLIACLKQV
jgi:23S rRNA (uracil1939-C5)-methyltransferase